MASRRFQKRVVANGVERRSNQEHRIKRDEGTTEQEIFILFDKVVDYVVEKLNITDLPDTNDDDGKRVTWFVNFQVLDAPSPQGKPVNGVKYRMLFPALPAGHRLVIYDGARAAYFGGTIGDRTHDNRQWKEISLEIGDPGGGSTPGT